MRTVLPILLLGLAGLLLGGAISLRRQGVRWPVVVVLGLLAVLSAAAGVLWMVGADR
ncbi:MAG: hypothetical protein IRY85_03335 [Micromonosporaceae bacterium]|nr:hypothetical protein [Micromonosporaceae bacterium]